MNNSQSNNSPRILALGAHPDDCDIKAGGSAALWTQVGCTVQFVSVTNGQSGHHEMSGEELVSRRTAEAKAAGKVAGIEYLVMDNPDGMLLPGLEERFKLMRLIREFCPDLILTHRPNDYHPDHRYTSQLVQDCSFLVGVPNVCPESPAMKHMPVIAYFSDHFQKPLPFKPDVAVDIDSVIETKLQMLDCHESQVYEWLPWVGQMEAKISDEPDERRKALKDFVLGYSGVSEEARARLIHYYGAEHAASVNYAESFEACEYGSPLDEAAIKRLFPFLA
jgi:LmbE family N-acetylglucosaminyl deacetylase